ncbi:MAG TPA: prolipoprotein diacylglyceryl transferase [Armatimonadetes bacterium]|nr:prolipoprotein diacylglyceryl transferase [Armatimonadota bacterium]
MFPVLFKVGPVAIHSYGLMAAIAVLIGYHLALRNCRRFGISPRAIEVVALLVVVGGLVGARMVFVLENASYYFRHPLEVLYTWRGGLSWHGALLGGTIVAFAYAKRAKIPTLDLLDCFAPIAALGLAIGRIGCFLNGCCYGVPTDLPWGIRFRTPEGGLTPPSHPAQLYAFLGNFLLFIGLWRWQDRRKFSGHVFLAYLAWYSVLRGALEWIRRGVTAPLAIDGVTWGQVVSAVILAVALFLIHKGKAKAGGVSKGDARKEG